VATLESLFDALLDISKIDVGVIRATLVDSIPWIWLKRLAATSKPKRGKGAAPAPAQRHPRLLRP